MGNTNKPQKVLENFFEARKTTKDLWNTFDADGNGYIDEKELDDIIHNALVYFAKLRDENAPAPKRERTKPFIQKIRGEILSIVDENKDGSLTPKEFVQLGKFLQNEKEKILKEQASLRHATDN